MTDVRSNLFGKYSENDLRQLTEESRIMEMRWQVFEGLYDTTRQELEKLSHIQNENIGLTAAVKVLQEEIVRLKEEAINFAAFTDRQIEEIESLRGLAERTIIENENLRKLAEEAILENEKLHKQIALYIDPLKELENKQDIPITYNEFFNEKQVDV